MRSARVLAAVFTLVAATAEAQSITLSEPDGARAGVRVGYGGRGVDWDLSVDSPRIAQAVRFRAGVGTGSWIGINGAGNEPPVTRVAGAALLFLQSRNAPANLLGYVGVGFAAFIPHRDGMRTRTGPRLILGMEGSGERWSVGPEFEIDIASDDRNPQARDLLPTARIGVAVRRRF